MVKLRMSEQLPPLSDPRERLPHVNMTPGKSIYYPREEYRGSEAVVLYNMGTASAFMLRAKRPLSVDEYLNVLHDNQVHSLGVSFFPSGEGTEFSGFVTSKRAMRLLQSLPDFTLSVGLASAGSQSYIEYDGDNNFANLGCTAMVAAARGIYEGGGVWQLAKDNETSREVIGYKGTILTKHLPSEVEQAVNNHRLPSDTQDINYRQVEYYGLWPFSEVYAIKIDINQFTNTLLGLDNTGQETFLQQSCLFFHDVESDLQKYNKSKKEKGTIFLGSRCADSTIFYVQNVNDIEAIEQTILEMQQKHGVSIKTVGKKLSDVRLHTLADRQGKDMWNGRVFHSTKPVTEKEWRELEVAAVGQNFPQHKVYFGK